MAKRKILTFDYGATSGRAILGEYENGKLTCTEIHRFQNNPVEITGHLYWDILRLFHELKQGLIKAAIAGHKDIDSIGIDTWGVDFALLDENGMLLANPFAYRDCLTDGELERVDKFLPLREIYDRTGIQLIKFNTLFQLTAIKDKYPDLLARTKKLIFIPDLLNYFLTGNMSCEFSIASTSSMYNLEKKDWDTELLEKLGIDPAILPPITGAGRVLGRLLPNLVEETGIDAEVRSVCGHDTGSAYLAIPMEQGESCACLSCGTWSLLGTELEAPVVSDAGFRYNYANEGGYDFTTRYLKNIMGLWIYGEVKREFERREGDVSYDVLNKEIMEAPAFKAFIDPDDELFMAPHRMVEKIKSYCEKTGQWVPQTRGEVMRVAQESLALKYRYAIDGLEEILGKELDTMRVVGGGCNNVNLMEFTANALGRKVICGPIEATAIGNMTAQLLSLGEFKDRWEARKVIGESFEQIVYEPTDAATWADAYARFKAIIEK
ncbi:MAG: rhamnulokinase [Clostridia bacterium]|nr:rhamnulokinase [Clostridia bacterium]